MPSSVAKKLGIKKGQRVLIMNAPQGFVEGLMKAKGEMPEGVTIDTVPDGQYDVVQFFALNKADVDAGTPYVTGALKPEGKLWFAYPKKTSSIKTDIHRNLGWDAVTGQGFEGVASIAMDEKWSALRFRPAENVKRSATSTRAKSESAAKPAANATTKAATKASAKKETPKPPLKPVTKPAAKPPAKSKTTRKPTT